MKDSLRIICCGHAAYDLNFMMDEFPIEDCKYKVDELVQTGGGPAANAASLCATWGIATAYAGQLGDDIYGRLILKELENSGVDISLVQIDSQVNTPVSAVIVNQSNGSRTILNRRNEKDQPEVTDQLIDTLRAITKNSSPPAVLHFDGHALDLSLKMMEIFPDAKTVVDAGSFREASHCLCAAADFAVCSRRYAEDCTGIDDVTSKAGRQRCVEKLSSLYPGRIIVTLGAEGLFYGEKNGPGHHADKADGIRAVSLPAFNTETVDSTGAGDIFHAAFSYGLLEGYSFENNLRLASAAAALSVTKPGGRTSIPGLKDSLKLAGIKA